IELTTNNTTSSSSIVEQLLKPSISVASNIDAKDRITIEKTSDTNPINLGPTILFTPIESARTVTMNSNTLLDSSIHTTNKSNQTSLTMDLKSATSGGNEIVIPIVTSNENLNRQIINNNSIEPDSNARIASALQFNSSIKSEITITTTNETPQTTLVPVQP